MLYPDLSRLALACPTGMMQAAAAPAPAAPATGLANVVTIWNNLTPLQQQTVIELLELDKQRAANNMSSANTMDKTLVFKATRNKEALLPLELQNRQWKQQPWIVVLSAPQYRHLFTAAEEPGFYGHQIGEDEPNQAKDYGRHLVYNPWGGWEHPRYYNSRPTGANPASLAERDEQARLAWEYLTNRGATPASQDAEARRAQEALDRLDELRPPDGVPPAPPPPEQQPELNVWNGLNGAQQNIVLLILAQKKELREYKAGYKGHPPGVSDRVNNAVEYLAAQLPPALNTPAKFNSTDWELALEGMPQYDRFFGIGDHDDE